MSKRWPGGGKKEEGRGQGDTVTCGEKINVCCRKVLFGKWLHLSFLRCSGVHFGSNISGLDSVGGRWMQNNLPPFNRRKWDVIAVIQSPSIFPPLGEDLDILGSSSPAVL
jgi:hypothetical protein